MGASTVVFQLQTGLLDADCSHGGWAGHHRKFGRSDTLTPAELFFSASSAWDLPVTSSLHLHSSCFSPDFVRQNNIMKWDQCVFGWILVHNRLVFSSPRLAVANGFTSSSSFSIPPTKQQTRDHLIPITKQEFGPSHPIIWSNQIYA